MNRRIVGRAVALAALLMFTLTGGQALAGEKAAGKKDDSHHSELFDKCAKACTDCMRECESCAHHCAHLVSEGKKDHLKTLGTCIDCSDFCATAARIVARHGGMAVLSCESCAKACDTCAKACEEHPTDEHMARCAKACRDCARACREMVQHAAHLPASIDAPKK
jgi:Domain of Unknown Function (DUF326)